MSEIAELEVTVDPDVELSPAELQTATEAAQKIAPAHRCELTDVVKDLKARLDRAEQVLKAHFGI